MEDVEDVEDEDTRLVAAENSLRNNKTLVGLPHKVSSQ